jgi:phosphoribosylformylglycinamidine cyclo-ligase
LFAWLQATAAISDEEMNRTFNNGIGMVVIAAPEDAASVAEQLAAAGESVHRLGSVATRGAGAAVVVG